MMASNEDMVTATTNNPYDDDATITQQYPPRKGWMYKQIDFFGMDFGYYASPTTQVVLVSFTCFLCPGMYNALSGLGGGGQVNADVANKAAVAIYSAFAATAFFGGTVCNIVGEQNTVLLGTLGYPIYVGSFLSYNINQNGTFVIVAGALLGIGAGLLWTAEGGMMMAYASEDQKGRYVAIFWAIFNMGAVIGSLVPLIQTANASSTDVSAGNGTYIGFLILTILGVLSSLALVKTKHVVRRDGSRIITQKQRTMTEELVGVYKVLREVPLLFLLFPLFLSSNWFYAYQFNDYNLARFNIRTRSLNSLMYWLAQIMAAYLFSLPLDWTRYNRRTRAIGGLVLLFVFTMLVWGLGYDFQKGYTRESVADGSTPLIDWTDGTSFAGPFVHYFFYGAFDAVYQTYIYWLLGAMSNSSSRLVYLAGIYKSLQSVGSAVTFQLDNALTSYMTMLLSNWILPCVAIVLATPVAWLMVHDHSEDESQEVVLGTSEQDGTELTPMEKEGKRSKETV